jgi:hypothetical protein
VTAPPKWRLSLRGLMLTIAVIAAALGLGLQYRQAQENRRLREENRRLAKEAAQARFNLELEEIAFRLKVPTEALYHAYMPRGGLDRLRWEAIEKFGVEREFVPIYLLYDHSRTSPHLHKFAPEAYGLEYWKTLQDSFWEGYAINHADDGASLLVARLKHSEDFRRRLMGDLKTADEYLKPLLVRMARAPDPRARYAAIEALLLLGDRSEIMRSVLRESLRRSDNPPRGLSAIERAKFYSVDPQRARRLVEEYDLEEWVAGQGVERESR